MDDANEWTEEQAEARGAASGVEDVDNVLHEQGAAVVIATLQPGCVGWDEGAINAGAAELDGVPERFHEAYYRAYAKAGRQRAEEIARA